MVVVGNNVIAQNIDVKKSVEREKKYVYENEA